MTPETLNNLPETTCSKCGQPGEFRPGHKQCRECEREYGRERNHRAEVSGKAAAYREEHRDHYRKLNVEGHRRKKTERHIAVDQLKNVPCADCGKSFPSYVMDYDHRDPTTKEKEISFLLNKTTCPWQRILDEIAKCDVVCACCHRLRTWKPGKNPLDARRKLISTLKNVPCTDCGDVFHYSQMDFDHVRGEKIDVVSHMSSKEIPLEAAKCDVVCANCHRERTQKQCHGQARLNPETIDMVWKCKTQGAPQTMVMPYERDKTPKYRPWHELAGTKTDEEVAKAFGISIGSVCIYRKKMSIPSFLSHRPAPDWHSLVGSITDSALAEKLGISRKTIAAHREQYKLPVYYGRKYHG